MIQAVIFGLDGVLITTDECRYQAWKEMTREQGLPFDRAINEQLRCLDGMASLNVILKKAERHYTEAEKLALSMREYDLYLELLGQLEPDSLLPGALETVCALRKAGLKTAIATVCKDAAVILKRLGMDRLLDAVVIGDDAAGAAPEAEAFLRAARKLSLPPPCCLAVKGSEAGVDAARKCGMPTVGVGAAARHPALTWAANTLAEVDLAALIASLAKN